MSADNGIYIAHFAHDNTWRVIYAQAIDNLSYYLEDSQERILEWEAYFIKAFSTSSKEKAYEYASMVEDIILESDFPIIEYGISYIGEGPDIGPSEWTIDKDVCSKFGQKQRLQDFLDGKQKSSDTGDTNLQPDHSVATERFWLVWNPVKGSPTFRHPTQLSAEIEALRLSEKESITFYVLEAITRSIPPTNWRLENLK